MSYQKSVTYKLTEIATIKTGKLNSNAAKENGKYPFFTCSQEIFRTDTYFFDGEYVILAGNNANGIYAINYFSGKFDAYQRTYVIQTKDGSKLINRYLYYMLKIKLNLLQSISTGAATKFLTLTIFNDLDINIPSLQTQHKFASILSAYDDLIENNTRRIAILEEMVQTIYQEWFVRFRYPGYEKNKMVESELGMIPEGWDSTIVEKAFQILGGGTPSTKEPEYWDQGDINWYSPSDLTSADTMFIKESTKKITSKGLRESSARTFPAYSVMMTSRATIGVTAINTLPACTNQGFITCIPNEKLSAYQIYYWLAENKEKISRLASGATFKEINRTTFKQLSIIVPDLAISQRFNNIVKPILKQIENLTARNINLKKTRDLLLPKLISGAIDVETLGIDIPDIPESEAQQQNTAPIVQPEPIDASQLAFLF